MTPALRWAVMRAILMFHYGIVRDKVTDKTVSTILFLKESRIGFERPRSLCFSTSGLTPYRYAKPAHRISVSVQRGLTFVRVSDERAT